MDHSSRAYVRAARDVRWDCRARVGRATARLGLALAVASVGLLLSDPAVAQQDTVPPDSVAGRQDTLRFELETLEVEATRPTVTGGGASGVELQLDSVPAPPSPTLSQILEEMPLVRIRRNSRGQVQPSLRGMEEREVAVLVDGVPITLGWDNRTDLSVVPLTGARTVEMVRGLSSVLAGPNVLGGVVEVGITRGPVQDSLETPLRFRSGVDHTGALDLAGEARSLFRPGGGTLLVRAGGGYRTSDGVELPNGVQQPVGRGDLLLNSDLEHRNGFLAARWRAPGGAWLSLSTIGFRSERGVSPELHLLGSDEPTPRFWRVPDHWRSVSSLSGGTGWGETPWGEGDLEAAVGLDVQYQKIASFRSLAYRDSVGGEIGEDLTATLRLLGDHTLGAGMLRGALTLAETRHEQSLQPGGTDETFGERWWSFGVETEQPLDPGGSSGGAFHDPRITLGTSVDGSSYPETGDKPERDAIWGWGARLSGQVGAADGLLEVHGGVSRKVRFPALRELFSGALGKFEPNPDLGPVTLKVGEIGATLNLEGLELQAIVFQQRLEGSIVRAVVEDGMFQRQNRGETRSTGTELVANGRLGPVTVRADLTLQDVSLREDDGDVLTGEQPEYQPEVVAGLHGNAPLALGVRARASFEYLGSQYGTDPRTGASVELDPSAYLEVGLERRLFEGRGALPPVRLAASVENLTDEAIFDQLGLPRPGRTFRVQLEMR